MAGLVFNPLVNGLIPAAGSDAFKDPVPTAASLPVTGSPGDVIYVLDSNNLYGWNGSAYVQLTVSGGAATKIEKFTLTPTDITNKYVVLASVPVSAANIVFLIEGGPAQSYTLDYTVTVDDGGKRLSWSGLGLDGLIASAEQICVIYN